MPEETGWLVEMKNDRNGDVIWLGISEHHAMVWTKDASDALRFSREEDAARMADYMNEQHSRVFLHDLKAVAVEHAWG